MKRQTADRPNPLPHKAVMVTDRTEVFPIQIVDLDDLIGWPAGEHIGLRVHVQRHEVLHRVRNRPNRLGRSGVPELQVTIQTKMENMMIIIEKEFLGSLMFHVFVLVLM